MTKDELKELYDGLCYGHEAEIVIDDTHYFLEWDKNEIQVFELRGDVGDRITSFVGRNKAEAVEMLFSSPIGGKILNDKYMEVQIIDIE